MASKFYLEKKDLSWIEICISILLTHFQNIGHICFALSQTSLTLTKFILPLFQTANFFTYVLNQTSLSLTKFIAITSN
jgi:hypothetical protein